jgi:paraquat-inducible protein A
MNAASSVTKKVAMLGCECCGLVSDVPVESGDPHASACPRCGEALHACKPHSLQRTWAYLIAASLAYVPANFLPLMSTSSGFRRSTHTLLGGIAELWKSDAWGLAMIVFIASIAVPLMKIGTVALLAWSVRYAPRWRQKERARLFRSVEAVGHWSMLDVYVVVLLAAFVRFGSVASVTPEPGLLAFAAVVFLTMLAAQSFDARLIWPASQSRVAPILSPSMP